MILITGSTGLVGQCLTHELDKQNIAYTGPRRDEFNLTDPCAIKAYLEGKDFDCIVHLAAETNVDLCEVQRTHALLTNYISTQVIADYCAARKIKLIFISTSGVLAGNGKFQNSEIELPAPSNFYSLTKLRAEEYITKTCPDYLTIRAAWMVGKTSGDNKKFAEKITKQIFDNVPEVKAVSDLYGSITSGARLAKLIIENLNKPSQAIIHCASGTACSRYEIAKYIQGYFKSATVVKPVRAMEFPLSAPRGFSEGLTAELAALQFGYVPLTWEEELNDFLGTIHA